MSVQNLSDIINNSYSRYANYVIQERALPYIEDGLKPSQRRILWTGYVQGYKPSGSFRKSGAWVNTTMGDYHPHGDASIYETSGNMTAPWCRVQLINGRGNFGFTYGDSFGSPRYTEQKMSEAGWSLMEGIDENAVDMVPNYSNSKDEPVILPVSFPILAVNGAEGIAVGFACSFPQHNPLEVMDLCAALLDNPKMSTDEMIEIIPGPDWQTGGEVFTQDEDGNDLVKQYFETGRARLLARATAHIEKNKIVITELPYGMTEEKVKSGITSLLLDGKIDGPRKVEILSGKSNGLEVVITVRRGANPQQVLDQLYSISKQGLSSTVSVNMNAIDENGEPRIFSFREVLLEFLETRKKATRRILEHRLNKAKDRLDLLDGLMKVVLDIDKAISIIRNADNVKAAQEQLMDQFRITDVQAKHVLSMQLSRLTKQDSHEIEKESEKLTKEVDSVTKILGSEARLKTVIRKDIEKTRKLLEPYGERKTVIRGKVAKKVTPQTNKKVSSGNWGIDSSGYLSDYGVDVTSGTNTAFAITKQGKIKVFNGKGLPSKYRPTPIMPEDEMENIIYAGSFTEREDIVIITTKGKALRLDPRTVSAQGIAGTGVAGIKLGDADVAGVCVVKPDDHILTIGSSGYWKVTKASDIPIKGRGAQGVILHKLKRDETKVTEVVSAEGFRVGGVGVEPMKISAATKKTGVSDWETV